MSNCNEGACGACSTLTFNIVKEEVRASISIEAPKLEGLEEGIDKLSASFKAEGYDVSVYGRGSADNGNYTATLSVTRVKGRCT